MPKVTYHEYRPGRWVKLVDGKAVGPATVEEVDRWRRERAAQARIWQDVVKKAQSTPTPPKPERSARQSRKAANAKGIWEDVVSHAAEPAEQPPGTIEEAIRSARHGKPVPVQSGKVADPSRPARAIAREQPPPKTTPAEESAPRDPDHAPPSSARSTRDTGAPVTSAEMPLPQLDGAQPAAVAPVAPKPAGAVEQTRPDQAPTAITRKAKPSVTPPARAGQARTAGLAAPPSPPGASGPQAASDPEPSKPRHVAGAPAPAETRPIEPALSEELLEAELEPPDEPSLRERDETSEAAPATAKPAARRPHSSRPRRKAPPPPAAAEAATPSYLWIVAGPSDDLPAVARTGLARYEERFQETAGAILCHEADLPVLEAAKLDVDVRHREGLAPRNFWIGSK